MFDLNKLNQYIITMSSNPFLSKEVKFKRVKKGFAIAFPLTIMIFVIGNHYINLIDDTLRDHYVGEKQEKVLGVEDSEPKLIGSYGDVSEDDTFVWDWNWEREGYYGLEKHIVAPEYYHKSNQIALKDEWIIKNGYELRIDCGNLDLTKIAPFDPYSCKVYYNNKLVSEDLTYTPGCHDSDNYTNCVSKVRLILYSDTFSDSVAYEYLVLGTYASGSKEWVSLYRLGGGEFQHLPFDRPNAENGGWYISAGSMELYGLQGDWEDEKNFKGPLEFVTYFHEPSMGSDNNVEGIYRIWSVGEEKLELKENIIDLYREGDQPHWY